MQRGKVWRWLALPAAVLAVTGCASTPGGGAPQSGLVVREVEAGSVAARAGVQVGDLLLSWQRGERRGELVSPFDLDQARVEEAPVGAVAVHGARGGERASFELAEGQWGLKLVPRLGGEGDRDLAAALAGGEQAVKLLRSLAQAERRPSVAAWLLVTAAETPSADAGELWAVAAEAAAPDGMAVGWVHQRHGDALRASRVEEAAEAYSQALEQRPQESLARAASLNALGVMARFRGDLESADQLFRQALEIQERLAPRSLAPAVNLNNLGTLATLRGQLDAAEALYQLSRTRGTPSPRWLKIPLPSRFATQAMNAGPSLS